MELKEELIPKQSVKEEIKGQSILDFTKNGFKIFRNSIPLILAFECLPLANIANVFWLNRAGASEEVVAAYCIAYTWTFTILNSLFMSLNQGLTVLISQAFGAKEYKLCGAYLHRGLVIDLTLMIPFTIILLCSQSILPALGIDANIVNLGMSYCRFAIPAFFSSACFDALKSFIISQHVFDPIVYIQVSTIGLHFFWSYLTIVVFDWGIAGAGICRIFEDFSNLIILYQYIKKSRKFEKTFISFENEFLRKDLVIEQTKFMIYNGSIQYLQSLYFDAMMILAGTFGPVQTIVHNALVQTSSISFVFFLGTSITVSSLIGNAFGAKDISSAKRFFQGGLFTILTFVTIWIFMIGTYQESWIQIWTTDLETSQLFFKTLKILLFFQTPLDALFQAQIALLRASEKQKFVTNCTLTCWYLIGRPLIIIFAIILDMKVFGLWLAFSVASTVMLVRFILEINKLDYDQIILLIQDRIKRNKEDNAIELFEHNSQIEVHIQIFYIIMSYFVLSVLKHRTYLSNFQLRKTVILIYFDFEMMVLCGLIQLRLIMYLDIQKKGEKVRTIKNKKKNGKLLIQAQNGVRLTGYYLEKEVTQINSSTKKLSSK